MAVRQERKTSDYDEARQTAAAVVRGGREKERLEEDVVFHVQANRS